MRGARKLGAGQLGAGLTLAACLAGSAVLNPSAAVAGTSALAASTRPPGPTAAPAARSFHSWAAAQRAAKFGLLRPENRYSLKLIGTIHVERCHVTGETSKRLVDATYGKVGHALLGIEQNNSGGPCGNGETVKALRTYRMHGVTAQLSGLCGMTGLPSCRSKKIFLFLTWAHHGIYYQAVSSDEGRATIVGFARGLTRVS
jgi:hypothetical protein